MLDQSPLRASPTADPGVLILQGRVKARFQHPEYLHPEVAFRSVYSDTEIAAVSNYVTGRFGGKGSQIAAPDVAELRNQTSRRGEVEGATTAGFTAVRSGFH
jgi:hypothetical protein